MYASVDDFRECRALHRRFGTSYYLASRRFPSAQRRATDAIYGFVRVPDEWVDNPGTTPASTTANKLEAYRSELRLGLEGRQMPNEPVLRAFCDVARQWHIDPCEAELFSTRWNKICAPRVMRATSTCVRTCGGLPSRSLE